MPKRLASVLAKSGFLFSRLVQDQLSVPGCSYTICICAGMKRSLYQCLSCQLHNYFQLLPKIVRVLKTKT